MKQDNVGLVHISYLPDMMAYGVGLPPYKLDTVVVGYRCHTHIGIAFSEHHLALFRVSCPPFPCPFLNSSLLNSFYLILVTAPKKAVYHSRVYL